MARKPAQIVKCPHCSWTGSARGLFTHSRLSHPSLPTPKTKGKPVYATANPNAVGSITKPIKSFNSNSMDPFSSKEWIQYERENILSATGIRILWKVAQEFVSGMSVVSQLSGIPEEEGNKPITSGVIRKGVRKRTK